MELRNTILALAISLTASTASAQQNGESVFPAGSEPLGLCVLNQLLEASRTEGARQEAILSGRTVAASYRTYPRNRLELATLIREFIGNCPTQRFQAAQITAQISLDRESILGEELSYFGAIAEDAVVSALVARSPAD